MPEEVSILSVVIIIATGLLAFGAIPVAVSKATGGMQSLFGSTLNCCIDFINFLISFILDIRCLSQSAILFTVFASYEGTEWAKIALIPSIFLFFLSLILITAYLHRLYDSKNSPFKGNIKNIIEDPVLINRAFLGLVGLFISLWLSCYNYHAVSLQYTSFPIIFYNSETWTMHDFFLFAVQITYDALPTRLREILHGPFSTISMSTDYIIPAVTVRLYHWLWYMALAGMVISLFKKK